MTRPTRSAALLAALLAAAIACTGALAAPKGKKGPANVVGVAMSRNLDQTIDLRVTIRSADKGPEHFCDRFEILDPEGRVLHVERIAQPHVNEQPFSVSLTNLRLPEGLERVTFRARMRPDGASGTQRDVKLPAPRRK